MKQATPRYDVLVPRAGQEALERGEAFLEPHVREAERTGQPVTVYSTNPASGEKEVFMIIRPPSPPAVQKESLLALVQEMEREAGDLSKTINRRGRMMPADDLLFFQDSLAALKNKIRRGREMAADCGR